MKTECWLRFGMRVQGRFAAERILDMAKQGELGEKHSISLDDRKTWLPAKEALEAMADYIFDVGEPEIGAGQHAAPGAATPPPVGDAIVLVDAAPPRPQPVPALPVQPAAMPLGQPQTRPPSAHPPERQAGRDRGTELSPRALENQKLIRRLSVIAGIAVAVFVLLIVSVVARYARSAADRNGERRDQIANSREPAGAPGPWSAPAPAPSPEQPRNDPERERQARLQAAERQFREGIRFFRGVRKDGDASVDFIISGGGEAVPATSEGIHLESAYRRFLEAAEAGHPLAGFFVGWCHAEGMGAVKSKAKSKTWFQNAIAETQKRARDDSDAQFLLGMAFLNGWGLEVDEGAGVSWLKRAADRRNPMAMTELGYMQWMGSYGEAADEAKGVSWFRQAVKRGDVIAYYRLAQCYELGAGVPRDDGEALRLYIEAAERGDPDAADKAGAFYLNGRGAAKNEDAARRWFRRAFAGYLERAQWGQAAAQYEIAIAYHTGLGAEKNPREALKWVRLAADQDLARAQRMVAEYYENGMGELKADAGEAARWYRKGAKNGDADAQRSLGVLLYQGNGAAKDAAEAALWFSRAADQGDDMARFALGLLYFTGEGVAKDIDKATALFRQAKAGGVEEADKWLEMSARKQARNAEDGRARADEAATRTSASRERQPIRARTNEPPARVTLDCGGGAMLELALIPAGTYMMGSPATEKNRGDDEVQHRVTISRPFYLGIHEVTQAQYRAVTGTNPSRFRGDDHPVENVSWDDAAEFCRKLSAKTGRKARLPTEAEWEYACRAGTTAAYYHGNDPDGLARVGNVADAEAKKYVRAKKWINISANDGYGLTTAPVGKFRPNAWGLYDMHGNVWEWCSDWYGVYPQEVATDPQEPSNAAYRTVWNRRRDGEHSQETATDPQGPSNGAYRVLRGGSWNNGADYCRSAKRLNNLPAYRRNGIGFRVALD